MISGRRNHSLALLQRGRIARKRNAIERILGLLSGLCGIVTVWPPMLFALIGVLIIVLRYFQWLKTGIWGAVTLHNNALKWWAGKSISIDKFDSDALGA